MYQIVEPCDLVLSSQDTHTNLQWWTVSLYITTILPKTCLACYRKLETVWSPFYWSIFLLSFFFFFSLFLLKFLFCVYFINYNAHQIIISHKPKSYSSKFGGSCPYISIFVMDMPISKSDFTCILKSLDFYFFN